MEIQIALKMLDPQNDDHWTAQGTPRVGAVSELVGVEVSREEITNAAPSFTRKAASDSFVDPDTIDEPSIAEAGDKGADDGGGVPEAVADVKRPAPSPVSMIEAENVPKDSVLALPFNEVMKDHVKLNRASEELAKMHFDLVQQRNAIDERIKAVADKSEVVSIVLSRVNPKDNTSENIRTFLESQKVARLQKAERAMAFIASGTSAGDVAAALNPKSKIDQAMSGRKPPLGSKRPVMPHMGR